MNRIVIFKACVSGFIGSSLSMLYVEWGVSSLCPSAHNPWMICICFFGLGALVVVPSIVIFYRELKKNWVNRTILLFLLISIISYGGSLLVYFFSMIRYQYHFFPMRDEYNAGDGLFMLAQLQYVTWLSIVSHLGALLFFYLRNKEKKERISYKKKV